MSRKVALLVAEAVEKGFDVADRAAMLSLVPDKEFDDGMTKQSFKDSADINKIIKKAQVPGALSHLMKYPEPVYGEFENYDLLEAHGRLQRANEIFGDLPSEVRKDFDNDAFKFVAFAADPDNNAKLSELLPKIAEPGSFFPNPVQRGGQGAAAATQPRENIAADEAGNPAAGTEGTAENSGAEAAASSST